MQLARVILLIEMTLALSGCAIPTRQTDSFLHAPDRDIPDAYAIPGVPFVLQEKNFCGPASLAMVMAYAGKPVPVDALAEQVFTPGKGGTLQVDLIGGARRNGMMAVEVSGLSALLHEIAAGHPVLTFENQGLSWYPKWHYAVAFGYDLVEPSITLHSATDQDVRKNMRKFERSWKDSSYWGLVVLKPGELSASAGELAHVTAAAGLEQLGLLVDAELAYRGIMKKWPTSLGALIGMGNVRFAAQDPTESAKYLEQAVNVHSDSAIAWHNLATAQSSARQIQKARASASRAIALANPEDIPVYRESLAEILR